MKLVADSDPAERHRKPGEDGQEPRDKGPKRIRRTFWEGGLISSPYHWLAVYLSNVSTSCIALLALKSVKKVNGKWRRPRCSTILFIAAPFILALYVDSDGDV